MGDTTGFMKHDRELPSRREVPVRLKDWREVYEDFPIAKVRDQEARPRIDHQIWMPMETPRKVRP